MKYTISETTKTVTVETTEADGKVSLSDMEKATKRFMRSFVDDQPLQLEAPKALGPTEIDETPDPLEDLSFTDVSPEVLAAESEYDLANMTPANILPAE